MKSCIVGSRGGPKRSNIVGRRPVLELPEGDFEYRDVLGEVRMGRQRLIARGLVVAGRWWHLPQA